MIEIVSRHNLKEPQNFCTVCSVLLYLGTFCYFILELSLTAAIKSFFAFISFYLQVIKPLYYAIDPELLRLQLLLAV